MSHHLSSLKNNSKRSSHVTSSFSIKNNFKNSSSMPPSPFLLKNNFKNSRKSLHATSLFSIEK
jgi:hypothetical protein